MIENYCPIRNAHGAGLPLAVDKGVVCVFGGKFNKVLLHIKIMRIKNFVW